MNRHDGRSPFDQRQCQKKRVKIRIMHDIRVLRHKLLTHKIEACVLFAIFLQRIYEIFRIYTDSAPAVGGFKRSYVYGYLHCKEVYPKTARTATLTIEMMFPALRTGVSVKITLIRCVPVGTE